ncbi:MAG TPA: TIGR03435 family protein [Bryobacteraceae bacterium]|nr:TIGR03435 family protein [Bryobacteraceae bacterium]
MNRAAVILCVSALAYGQPRFEVATIKPVSDTTGSSGIYTGHGNMKAENVTLKRRIIGAYGVGPNQVVGGPDWLDTDRFNIVAKSGQDINDDEVLNRMVQALLAERFGLVLHRESRTMPAYVLEVAKGGPKMEKSTGKRSNSTTTGNNSRGILKATDTGMELLAQLLARALDMPVIDRTGLDGVYNFTLQWTPESAQSRPDAGPSIFTAIQEQLGLRLRAEKTAVPVLVIDRAERPAEN